MAATRTASSYCRPVWAPVRERPQIATNRAELAIAVIAPHTREVAGSKPGAPLRWVSAPGRRRIRAGAARLVEQCVASGERCLGAAAGKGAQDQPRRMLAVVEDRVLGRGRTQEEVPATGLARRVDDHADGRAGAEDVVEREDLDAREHRRQRRQQLKI